VVVAMIGDDVRQTRCTTCDADHAYKGGRLPARRKKGDTPDGLVKAVLESGPDRPPAAAEPPEVGVLLRSEEEPVGDGQGPVPREPAAPVVAVASAPEVPPVEAPPRHDDEGPVHRRLIRATLPRVEGQVPARQAPDFTLRLPGARLGPFRNGLDQPGGGASRQHEPNGNRAPRPHGKKRGGGPGSTAFAGHGHRQHAGQHGGRGQGGGHQPHHRHAGGKKRSR
jgi:hypothetical protein